MDAITTSHRQRWIALAIALTVAALLALTLWWRDGGNDGKQTAWPVTQVALAPVLRRDAPRAFHGVGELEAARQVDLAAETAGRVTGIRFDSGQQVKAGQVLVQLNDASEQADRLRLRAKVQNSQILLKRTGALLSGRVSTQEQYDNAIASRDMAVGELRQIEALIAQKAIRAPFSGVIGIRRVHPGQYLNAGSAVASLVDASNLNVNFPLDEQAMPHLRIGQPVQLRADAWPERVFPAEIVAIDPLVSKSRMVQVQARVRNPERLLQAGMSAAIQVLRSAPTPVLAIPETAVSYSAYGQTVFVARTDNSGRLSVQRVAVKTGQRWDGQVEVVAGLVADERVVVSGQLKLSDGVPVQAVARDGLGDSSATPTAAATGDQAL